jgi:hypothetical protein
MIGMAAETAVCPLLFLQHRHKKRKKNRRPSRLGQDGRRALHSLRPALNATLHTRFDLG